MKDVTPGVQARVTANLLTQGIVGALVHVLIGYVVGAVFSDHIYADLSRTEWSNLWVYFWLVFWPFALFWMFALYAIAFAVVVGVVFGVYRAVSR
jgi:ABC-type antimicrobial peptide transport system permease subunit